jgi:hypothetical protein
MPDATNAKAVKLTVQDPVSLDVLKEFNQLEAARHDIALRLLELEQERVRLLAAAHQVGKQHERLFEKVLVDRGLTPTTPVDIDSTTGIIKVRVPAKPAETDPAS